MLSIMFAENDKKVALVLLVVDRVLLGNLALLAISNVVKKEEVWLLSWLIVMPRQKERWKRRRKAGWYLLQKLTTCLEIIACDNCQ